ncbi:MAG: to pyruvate kinase [Candidatus Parcubacteria bacterium]|jgi:pyruvate kinase
MENSKAQIVATIGPASKDINILSAMVDHKMDVARLNFSWGTHSEHADFIKNIRECAEKVGRKIPIIQDLSGPRIQEGAGHTYDQNVEVITEKDLSDLKFGIDQGVDYVALSFVGSGSDIKKLRAHMQKMGKIIPIIAKIERKIAIDNLDEIIAEADAIMVARGDLGSELPIETIPFAQQDIIKRCNTAGKSVIVATQMMLSMKDNPEPTRAEVTDVAFAIIEGADAVMLSEESASGKYPLEAVTIMERIIKESEKYITRPNRKSL